MSLLAVCDPTAPHIVRAFVNESSDEYGVIQRHGFFYAPVDEKLVEDGTLTVGMEYSRGEFIAYVPPAPDVVTAAQAKVALWGAGLLDRVTQTASTVEYMPMRLYFENATEWHRGNAYVQALGAELGLDSDTIDDLFRAASKL